MNKTSHKKFIIFKNRTFEMMPYQLDPRRYYPDAQEQSILIPYLRKYFKFPERSPERNRIASEVSNMLLKFSPHWTHRAVRLWFNNNRTTYIKIDCNDNPLYQNQPNANSNPNKHINMAPAKNSIMAVSPPQKDKIGLPPISYFASTPSSTMPSSLPSIEEFVSSSQFPRSIPNSPKGSTENFNNKNSNADIENFGNILNDAYQCSPDSDQLFPIISKINQICDSPYFHDDWPNYGNSVEFPPRQFSYHLSSLLNSSTQIWNNKRFNEIELPKIDFYASDSGMDSYIIDSAIFVHKGQEFVQVFDNVPSEITCYTTTKNFAWAITRSREIFRINISSREKVQPEVFVSTTQTPSSSPAASFPTSSSNSSLSASVNIDDIVCHVPLTLPFQPSKIHLCPLDDRLIIYSHDSSSITIAHPDMSVSNLDLRLMSPSILSLRASRETVACTMKNNVSIFLNDLTSGQIIRNFFGHSKEPNHLFFLDEGLLASSAKDSFVRLWDFSVKNPVMTLRTPKKSSIGLTGTQKSLISCLDDATVNVVDIRMPNEARPMLAFDLASTNPNVNPITVNFDPDENSLNFYLMEILPQAKIRNVYRTYPNLLS